MKNGDILTEELNNLRVYCENNLSYNEGYLYWVKCPSPRVAIGSVAGSISSNNGYSNIQILGKSYLTHRIIYFIHHNNMPDQLDHINTNKMDNRIENLRPCNYYENLCNQGLRSNNTSGFKGVHLNKKSLAWQANITHCGISEYLGSFKNKEDAINARRKANERQGEFAKK